MRAEHDWAAMYGRPIVFGPHADSADSENGTGRKRRTSNGARKNGSADSGGAEGGETERRSRELIRPIPGCPAETSVTGDCPRTRRRGRFAGMDAPAPGTFVSRFVIRRAVIVAGCCLIAATTAAAEDGTGRVRLRISWGHRSAAARPFSVAVEGTEVDLGTPSPVGLEAGEGLRDGAWETTAGGGDADGVELDLRYPERAVTESVKPHSIWAYLLEHADPQTALRLRGDPSLRPDSRRITVRANREGTRGFSLTVDQILRAKPFPVPSLDLYVAAGDPPLSFEESARAIAPLAGTRVLDRLRDGAEASCEEYLAKWEDMGSPSYRNPAQVGPGHIVPIGWEGSVAKFGIDRGAGAWSDYGNPDRHRLWLEVGDLGKDLAAAWKGQRLEDGLPVITTALERDGVRYEVEQLAWPLDGPPPDRRGDIRWSSSSGSGSPRSRAGPGGRPAALPRARAGSRRHLRPQLRRRRRGLGGRAGRENAPGPPGGRASVSPTGTSEGEEGAEPRRHDRRPPRPRGGGPPPRAPHAAPRSRGPGPGSSASCRRGPRGHAPFLERLARAGRALRGPRGRREPASSARTCGTPSRLPRRHGGPGARARPPRTRTSPTTGRHPLAGDPGGLRRLNALRPPRPPEDAAEELEAIYRTCLRAQRPGEGLRRTGASTRRAWSTPRRGTSSSPATARPSIVSCRRP